MTRPAVEYGASGRWDGRLTQKPLPEDDPSLAELTPGEREHLTHIWLVRAAMERRVADSFEVVAAALTRLKASPTLIELATRAIDDEYRHAELSRLVASRIAGRELDQPERLALEVPKHRGASEEMRDTLHVVGQCVLNETTASVYLETCFHYAEGALAKSALRELLSDEIDHGRIGWAHLAALDDDTRKRVGRWLLPMAYLNLRQWKYETPVDGGHTPALTKHGAPPADVLHPALIEALRGLIIPGLKALEIPTAALESWVDSGAQTDRPPTEFLGEDALDFGKK